MSLFETSAGDRNNRMPFRAVSRRGLVRTCVLGAVAASLGVSLGGCAGGFQPLYGSLGTTGGLQDRLAAVEIVPIPGRNGQRIRNELLFKTQGGAAAKPPLYRLEIAIKESATTTLVLRDGTSGGQIYQIDAKFQLINLTDKRVMLTGDSQSRATSERFSNTFSNVRSGEEAQERAAKTIATDLKARIAGFLGANST